MFAYLFSFLIRAKLAVFIEIDHKLLKLFVLLTYYNTERIILIYKKIDTFTLNCAFFVSNQVSHSSNISDHLLGFAVPTLNPTRD